MVIRMTVQNRNDESHLMRLFVYIRNLAPIQQKRKRFCSWNGSDNLKSSHGERESLQWAVCLHQKPSSNSTETKKRVLFMKQFRQSQIKSWIDERTVAIVNAHVRWPLNNTSEISWLGCTMVKDDSSKQKPTNPHNELFVYIRNLAPIQQKPKKGFVSWSSSDNLKSSHGERESS